jgi:hypothetical protein
MSKRDTSTTQSIWFASVLVFLGYELCCITEHDGFCEYKIQCSSLDFIQLESDYSSLEGLPLSNAKAFVSAFNQITHIQKAYRRRGETQYASPRWQRGEIG